MEMEGAGDFKALRAMFQNNPNFSNALLQLPTKSSPEIIPQQSTGDSSMSISKYHPCRQVKVPEPKTEPFPCMLQKSEMMMQVKPVVLPKVTICELPETSKNESIKGLPETLAQGTASGVEPQNQCPKSCFYMPETTVANDSFHQTLHVWKRASFQNDLKGSVVPLTCANRTTCHSQSRPSNVAVIAEAKAKTVENEQALILMTPKNPPSQHSGPAQSPTTAPPILPRRPVSLPVMEREAPKDTSFSLNTNSLYRQNKSIQCFTSEIHHDVNKIKLPKTKLLPSAILLGPPPRKPPRPPKVDLSTFQQYPPDAEDDAYLTPEDTATEGQSIYDEPKSYPKLLESSTGSFTVQETTHSSERKEDIKKKRFLTATPSTEMDIQKRGPFQNHDVLKQQANEMGKIADRGGTLPKVKISGERQDGRNTMQETTMQSFPGISLAKAGNYGYVSLETLKMDEDNARTLELCPRTPQPVPVEEELYDDVEGFVRGSDTIRSFTSDTEKTYEDVQNEDYNSTKLNDKVEKPKKFGKLFKKGKSHVKNAPLKDNSRNLSNSVPNLDVMAEESIVYDDIGTEQDDDTKQKNEIHKNWKLKFLTVKEKDRRRSGDEAEIIPSRNFFKTKKYNLEKNKEAKEEKLFREKFMYENKIKVINTAVAHCSNAPTKNELDLRITAGEQLEVIDITEGNQLICRNAEGKYGYVLIEHLNFRY